MDSSSISVLEQHLSYHRNQLAANRVLQLKEGWNVVLMPGSLPVVSLCNVINLWWLFKGQSNSLIRVFSLHLTDGNLPVASRNIFFPPRNIE